ncbi:phosphatidylinositol 4-kinase [Mucor ambiguus]|uniref:1-phosphatidylinositol 4-kinase n=1 Tax=Mucor ambiguus TaxID=91626 RepID=A0A0C9MBS9_9FUNG|nr:phosphatidylinositol 4-kinase [Mucor ambiguus]
MSNALLLRLFTSEFFNSWIAVSYLFRYSDNVGIQHYLCNELKGFPISEIEFFLPQLIHLLITRPSESVALECFLIEMCEKSTHIALMSLWYLQAYLSDLSTHPTSPSFNLCKRLLNRSQAIVFSEDSDDDDDDEDADPSRYNAEKVREHALPALVGMGAMLLGIGQPLMTKPAGRIAIAQGRRNRTLSTTSLSNTATLTRRNTTEDSSTCSTTSSLTAVAANGKDQLKLPLPSSTHSSYISTSQPDLPLPHHSKNKFNPFTSSPSLEDLHRGKAFSVGRYIKNAHHKLNRKMMMNEERKSTSSSTSLSVFDPALTALGQSSVPTNTAPLSPALSQCSADMDMVVTLDEQDSDQEQQKQHQKEEQRKQKRKSRQSLLRSNYFRSEMQFVLALVDIATRLVMVPKEARMSALHAELTLLNHNLPAEICLPLWCPATAEKPHHHRVVRISPSDAVVLNSAERAPYLLMIEVLDDEMNFENDDYNSALYRAARHKHANRKSIMSTSSSTTTTSSVSMATQNDDDKRSITSTTAPVKVTVLNTNDSSSRRNSRSADDYAERMRTAAVMLAQLQPPNTAAPYKQNTEQIRQRIIKEMVALEEQRMQKMKTEGVSSGVGGGGGEGAGGDMLEDEQRIAWVVNKEDPSAAVLSEDWETKKARLRQASPYGHLPNWRLMSVIVKQGADLRQEQFAIQLIREMQRIWEDTGVDVWVKYFRVLVTSDSSGLIETLKNTISIHSIKKDAYTRGWNEQGAVFTLYDYFEKLWGPPDSDDFIKAQDAFMRSLAGYSVACYVLQIKDRHNGNLLIDEAGHLIHIDFGFMLSNSPGSVGFEMAPFKLPQEYIDILGGVHGEKFAEYKALMKAAFLAVRKHSENILLLTEMMSKDSKLPCFQNGDLTVPQLRDRFQLQLTEPQAEEFVDKLIMSSCCNVFTRLYDTFQYYSQVSVQVSSMDDLSIHLKLGLL